MPRARSIHAHLVVLALLTLLPAWGLAGFAAWRFAAAEQARLLGIGQDAAADIAAAVGREVAALRAGLAALATSPALVTGDLAAFDRQLGLLYGSGALSVTVEAGGLPDRLVERPALARDPSSGRAVVLFEQHLAEGRDDSPHLILSTDAVRFWSPIIERARLPEGWVASVLGPDHVITARWPDPERFVGRPVHPAALAMLDAAPADSQGGWGSGSTREGDPVRIAWRSVPGMPWTVLVGVPSDAVDGALHRAMLPVIAIGLPLMLALSIGVAWWATRRIAKPLQVLEATALAAARRPVPEPPPPAGVREIDAAGQALATAAADVAAREAELAALAARLEAVLESTTDSVVVLDRALNPVYLNGRARTLLRRDGPAGPPLPFGPAFRAAFDQAFASGEPVSVTAPVQAEPGGPPRWFAADGFPSPRGLNVFFRDVTAAHLAEAALRASEARLQAVLEHVPVGVLLAEAPSGRVLLANRRLNDILGFAALPEAAVAGQARVAVVDAEGRPVPPEDRATARALRGEEGVRTEYRFRRPDGSLIWVRVLAAPIRDAAGHVTEVVAALTDIEAERAAALALQASEARFRGFAEASPDVVWMLEPGSDRLAYLSPAYEAIWGAAPPAPGAGRLADLTRGFAPAEAARIEAAILAGEPVEAELRLMRADGQPCWVRLIAFVIGGDGAGPRCVGGVARNITRRREATDRQSLLIAELNHRVKNTLATVLALARQTERSARRAADAGSEGEGPARDARFVADFQARLLALSRGHDLLTASTWRGAMLQDVAATSLAPWRDEPGGAARIRIDGPPVWLAPRQALGLALAIHEMATNATKHGALRVAEGQVCFTWTRGEDGVVDALWRESGGPPVTPPEGSGFGTRLLRQGLGAELGPGSEIMLDYPPAGFQARMRFQRLMDGEAT